MTIRQSILQLLYPLLQFIARKLGKNFKKMVGNGTPKINFYSLTNTMNNGSDLLFEELRGKKVLIVNTASNCGYTSQLANLQNLYEQVQDKVTILAFPSNDFQQQEKGSDESIAAFCKKYYHTGFILMKKSVVRKHSSQNEVYRWLSDKDRNGWNSQEPTWNFCKYLVNEKGELTHFFEAGYSPTGKEILSAIET